MHACVIACDYVYMWSACVTVCVITQSVRVFPWRGLNRGVSESQIMHPNVFGSRSNRCRVRVPRRSYVFGRHKIHPRLFTPLLSFSIFYFLKSLCAVLRVLMYSRLFHVSHSCATTSPNPWPRLESAGPGRRRHLTLWSLLWHEDEDFENKKIMCTDTERNARLVCERRRDG